MRPSYRCIHIEVVMCRCTVDTLINMPPDKPSNIDTNKAVINSYNLVTIIMPVFDFLFLTGQSTVVSVISQ
jgi:hypothetical protein